MLSGYSLSISALSPQWPEITDCPIGIDLPPVIAGQHLLLYSWVMAGEEVFA